jgi:hypothetical protein
MRKVTQQIRDAWLAGKARTIGNTRTDGASVWLHDNEIIRRGKDGEVCFTNAGWPSMTTHERLSGILGIGFHRKDWETYMYDSDTRESYHMDSDRWYTRDELLASSKRLQIQKELEKTTKIYT